MSATAPLAMICIAVFSSPERAASLIDEPPASATSCFEMSVGADGSPSTLTSMETTPPPWERMHSQM